MNDTVAFHTLYRECRGTPRRMLAVDSNSSREGPQTALLAPSTRTGNAHTMRDAGFLAHCTEGPFPVTHPNRHECPTETQGRRNTAALGPDATRSVPRAIQISIPSDSLNPTKPARTLLSSPIPSLSESTRTLLLHDDPSTMNLHGVPFHDDLYHSLIFPARVRRTSARHVPRLERNNDRLQRHVDNAVQASQSTVWFWKRQRLALQAMNLTLGHLEPLRMMGCTSRLTHVSLAGNAQLGSIPFSLIQDCPSLVSLDMTHCNLHELPASWDTPKLACLKLGHNRLTEFPEESILIGLPKLKTLVLYGNQITAVVFPASAVMANLESLNLGYNDLAWLPADVTRLRSLRQLDVSNNLLTHIPRDLCDLNQLRRVVTTSNPLVEPPLDVCDAGIKAMRRYWMKRDRESGIIHCSARCCRMEQSK